MGFAANAITDLAAPPAAPRASSGGADDASAPSFQDHIDARHDRSQRNDPPAKSEPRVSSESVSSSSDQTNNAARSDDSHDDAKPDDEAQSNPPVMLQLIANAATAVLGAKAEQSAAEADTAPANAANVGSDLAAALAAGTTAPNKPAPKTETAPRAPQVKAAKGATAKTTAGTDDAKAMAAQAPQEANAQVAAPPSVSANVSDGAAKSADGAKTQGIEAAQGGSARPTPQLTSGAQAPETPAPATILARPAAEAKNYDNAKASAPLQALKEAAQDLAPAAPKVQAAPSAMAPAATHAQLAEPVQQAASDASAARAAPVAAQVGGEIIRRFNGRDTSFQLRLDPPELGRVDVRLDVSRDHRVTAVISADSPQALSDLARGARDLQQALQSAGLDVADDGLRFDLSSNGQGNAFTQAQAQNQSNLRAANMAQAEPSIAPDVASRPLSIDSWRGSRVDLVA
ncbi:MAG: flagellar hook-length control protein FliK [Vitreimonas sp.]